MVSSLRSGARARRTALLPVQIESTCSKSTLIRATCPLQTQLLMALIIAILFSSQSSLHKMRISILFFVINNVAKSLKELVFDPPE